MLKINKYLDTITAISSGNINQAISVIRISGNNTLNIIKKIFKGKIGKNKTITYGHIINPKTNEIIDEVLVMWFLGNDNYTGEDTVEINAHGGIIVTNRILNLILENGARLAERGEFTRRAFLNNKISLTKAEAINNLIHAKTINQTKIAINQFNNLETSILTKIEDKLLMLISLCEINIDYSEYNDIETIDDQKLLKDVDLLFNELEQIISNSEKTINVYKGIDVAIIGKPNSGKSSLFNALIEKDKAIVTNIEGTTRDVLEDEFEINGILFRLLDTAGIRNTKDKIEEIGIQKTLKTIKEAKIIINLVDLTNPENNRYLDEFGESIKKDKIIINVINKIDLLDRNILNKYSNYVWISALNNNLYELKSALYKNFFEFSLDNVILDDDKLSKLKKASQYLISVKETLKNKLGFEIAVVDLKYSWEIIRECLNKDYDNEVLLDNLFKKFCLGK